MSDNYKCHYCLDTVYKLDVHFYNQVTPACFSCYIKTLATDVEDVIKESDQSLVSLTALVTPVREYVPDSPRDKIMRCIIKELKRRGTIDSAGGFTSVAEWPPFFYADCFYLNSYFFTVHCKRPPEIPIIKTQNKQLSLF